MNYRSNATPAVKQIPWRCKWLRSHKRYVFLRREYGLPYFVKEFFLCLDCKAEWHKIRRGSSDELDLVINCHPSNPLTWGSAASVITNPPRFPPFVREVLGVKDLRVPAEVLVDPPDFMKAKSPFEIKPIENLADETHAPADLIFDQTNSHDPENKKSLPIVSKVISRPDAPIKVTSFSLVSLSLPPLPNKNKR